MCMSCRRQVSGVLFLFRPFPSSQSPVDPFGLRSTPHPDPSEDPSTTVYPRDLLSPRRWYTASSRRGGYGSDPRPIRPRVVSTHVAHSHTTYTPRYHRPRLKTQTNNSFPCFPFFFDLGRSDRGLSSYLLPQCRLAPPLPCFGSTGSFYV